jgi:Cu(I)/Ag(I) efflux system membrane protein CusA/SilA
VNWSDEERSDQNWSDDYSSDQFSADDLIPDPEGQYFRQWRDHIKSPDDIWDEIVAAVNLPGVTSAPKLQPIETRLVMLQTGMRAPMGIKVRGSDLETIEAFGLELERELKEVEGVKDAAVFADRIVGKPYLLLDIKRDAIARYGLSVNDVQQQIQATVGGMMLTTTVEGRERYAVRLRYPRELRNDPESIRQILVPTRSGQQIPLGDLIDIRYEQGPQMIKSEDGFLVGYVLFDKLEGYAEVEVVNNAQRYLEGLTRTGELDIPAGISYRFAGNYEQQVRADARLKLVLPIALGLIFLILYFQFRSTTIALMVFSGVFVAFSGGFLLLGGYANPGFMDFDFFGTNLRDLFQMRTINLSVAVWVGFLALFGIATDDGVLVATFLRDSFEKNEPTSVAEVRDAVVEGGLRRVRPAMMTTATTILALLPVLTATGRGSDIMLPMAIPSFGGMLLQVVTMFTVPVLWSLRAEWKVRRKGTVIKAS